MGSRRSCSARAQGRPLLLRGYAPPQSTNWVPVAPNLVFFYCISREPSYNPSEFKYTRRMRHLSHFSMRNHIMIISVPRNCHYDSADILGPEIFNMRWFLAQEIVQKWWFLGPENFIMTLQDFWPKKLSFWDDFWPQKLSRWTYIPLGLTMCWGYISMITYQKMRH